MKLTLTLLAALFCCTISFAQAPMQTIKGVVIDSAKNQPLGYVTVAIRTAKTDAPVKSALSKDDGSFQFSLPVKSYKLLLASVGFKNKIIMLDSIKAELDLGRVLLSPASKDLNQVTVTALRPLMKQEVDRISYDVQADPESKAITALDMMRKVPLLTVDGNDNIKLKGSGNYKILINGKESALVARNPSDVLKAMPATNIEKIEVITTPPAKYDAEGLAGIINIITKKNADQGYNVTMNGRLNSVFGPGLNVSGTVKQGKFGLSGYAGMYNQNNRELSSGNKQNFLDGRGAINQLGTSTNGGHGGYGNAELSYEIDSLNLLTGSFEYYGGNYNQSSTQLSNQYNTSGGLLQRFFLDNTGAGKYRGLGASVNYQLSFKKKKDELLTLSYKYNYSPFTQNNDVLLSQEFNYNTPDYRQYNHSGNKEHTIQLDYVLPVKKWNIEAGGKAILRNNFSEFYSQNLNAATNQYVTATSNDFNYHQDVYSFYNSYQLKLEKWTAKGGLRLEHTEINADFAATGSTLDRSYNNLIPSISIQRSLKSSSINLGFTQRIQRPGIWQLNPFVDKSNPQFVNTGNPDLRPELNNTFELTYSNFKKGSVTVGLSYAFSDNAIQQVSSIQNGITLTTYQNLGSNRTLGSNFNINESLTKKLTLSLNGQLSHVWLKGTYTSNATQASALYTNDGYIGNAFMNLGYKFNKQFRIGSDLGYFSGDVTLQGHNTAFIYNAFVFTKSFMDEKASISFVANCPYGKNYTFKSYTNTVDYNQYSFNQWPYRSFALRFSYKFGKLNGDIKKNQRGISNDDTKGGGKSSGNQ